jgi:hypothetical protein
MTAVLGTVGRASVATLIGVLEKAHGGLECPVDKRCAARLTAVARQR